MSRFLLLSCALVVLAGCSSSSRPSAPTVPPARTFSLAGFMPTRVARPGPATISFTIRQPSGDPLTTYRRGAGPHTGVHLIVVRRDLGTIIHKHPPVGPDGRSRETIDFPTPGPYRLLVDAYPTGKNMPRNFQLHNDVRVAGTYRPGPAAPLRAAPPGGGAVPVDPDGRRLHDHPARPEAPARHPGGDTCGERARSVRQAGALQAL